MRYKKTLLVVLLLAAPIVLLAVLIYNDHEGNEQSPRYQQKTTHTGLEPDTSEQQLQAGDGVFTEKVISKNEITIRNPEKALRPGAVDFGEEFLTCMTDEYTEDTPLVEIYFMQRDKNGQVKPFKVWTLNIKRADGFPVGGFSVEGRNLRMGAGETQEPRMKSRWTLLRGIEYYVDKYSPREGSRLLRGLQPRFTVPQDLQGNQVYKVELILKDEIFEQKQLEAEKALARQRQERAEREKITIYIRQYPEPNSKLIGLYYDGKKVREFHDEEEGIMTLMGPNKLAGDLMVGVLPRGRIITTLRPWIYIKDLQKRELIVPDDANRVISKDELVDVQILLEVGQDEMAKSLKKIFFLPYRQAKVPLFCVLIQEQMRTDSGYAIKMPMLPGTYYPEGFIYKQQVEEWIPLGSIEIGNEPGKTYTINLPSDK